MEHDDDAQTLQELADFLESRDPNEPPVEVHERPYQQSGPVELVAIVTSAVTAATTGVIGNAVYDAVKAPIVALLRRRRAARATAGIHPTVTAPSDAEAVALARWALYVQDIGPEAQITGINTRADEWLTLPVLSVAQADDGERVITFEISGVRCENHRDWSYKEKHLGVLAFWTTETRTYQVMVPDDLVTIRDVQWRYIRSAVTDPRIPTSKERVAALARPRRGKSREAALDLGTAVFGWHPVGARLSRWENLESPRASGRWVRT